MDNHTIHKSKHVGLNKMDLWHHLILLVLLVGCYSMFRTVSYSRILQFLVGTIAAILYILWGILHHYLDHDLHSKNVIEYIFIGLLAVVILGGLLL